MFIFDVLWFSYNVINSQVLRFSLVMLLSHIDKYKEKV